MPQPSNARRQRFNNMASLTSTADRAASFFSIEEGRAYRELDRDLIIPNPDQPRKYFDQGKLEEMALTIEKHGLIQPITVQEVDVDGKQMFKIIAGERRWRALCLTSRQVVPSIVTEGEDPAAVALIENVQRVDLHCLELAEALQALIREKGLTQEDAAAMIGKSQEMVAKTVNLLNLPSDILLDISHHRSVGASILTEIAYIPDPKIQRELWEQAKKGCTIREFREARKAAESSPAVGESIGDCGEAVPRAILSPGKAWGKVANGIERFITKQMDAVKDIPSGQPLSEKTADELRASLAAIDTLCEKIRAALAVS